VPSEVCIITINPPDGAAGVNGVRDLNLTLIVDPGENTISDEFTATSVFPGLFVEVIFISDDSSESNFELCSTVFFFIGCGPTENGQVQTAGTITWLDSTGAPLRTDTIEFASDTTEVPEPASWLLVLTGLPLLGRRRLRRPRWVS